MIFYGIPFTKDGGNLKVVWDDVARKKVQMLRDFGVQRKCIAEVLGVGGATVYDNVKRAKKDPRILA